MTSNKLSKAQKLKTFKKVKYIFGCLGYRKSRTKFTSVIGAIAKWYYFNFPNGDTI